MMLKGKFSWMSVKLGERESSSVSHNRLYE